MTFEQAVHRMIEGYKVRNVAFMAGYKVRIVTGITQIWSPIGECWIYVDSSEHTFMRNGWEIVE